MVKKLAELKAEEVAELKRQMTFFSFAFFYSLTRCIIRTDECRDKPKLSVFTSVLQEEEEAVEGSEEAEGESGAEDGSAWCLHR